MSQKIVNGNFETGNLSPWTSNDAFISLIHHAGVYGCELSSNAAWIKQTFTAIPVKNIVSFIIYALHSHQESNTLLVTAFYDDTSEELFYATAGYPDWHLNNLTSQLNTAKNLNAIQLSNTQAGVGIYVDDISIMAGYFAGKGAFNPFLFLLLPFWFWLEKGARK